MCTCIICRCAFSRFFCLPGQWARVALQTLSSPRPLRHGRRRRPSGGPRDRHPATPLLLRQAHALPHPLGCREWSPSPCPRPRVNFVKLQFQLNRVLNFELMHFFFSWTGRSPAPHTDRALSTHQCLMGGVHHWEKVHVKHDTTFRLQCWIRTPAGRHFSGELKAPFCWYFPKIWIPLGQLLGSPPGYAASASLFLGLPRHWRYSLEKYSLDGGKRAEKMMGKFRSLKI